MYFYLSYVVDSPDMTWCSNKEGFEYRPTSVAAGKDDPTCKSGTKDCNPVQMYWEAASIDVRM